MFTEKEINLVTNVFAQSKVSPTSPDAAEIVGLVQSVLKKMNDNKEKESESSESENRVTSGADQHEQSNGHRKDKTAEQVRSAVS